jgi:hypothetical protein
MSGITKSHVEGHATAIMRLENINQATLYINKQPCPPCTQNLKYMVPQGVGCKSLLLVGMCVVFPNLTN